MILTHSDLHSLEEYSRIRPEFKKTAVNHRKQRQVEIGAHMTLHFEDRASIKYQIQEMLLIEKTFDKNGIQDELDAYNPLIPTGNNLKATLTIEYGDPDERAVKLKELHRVEDLVYIQIGEHLPVYAIADEDMERSTEEKTSAVHFLRWEFDADQIRDFKNPDVNVIIGIAHEKYNQYTLVKATTQELLSKDFA